MHDPYAIAVLFVVEFVIMWYLDKFRGVAPYGTEDCGAVDLTPWEYRHHLWIGRILQPRADYDVPLPGHRRLSEAFRSNYAVIHRNIQRRPVVSEGKELSQTKMKSV